MPDKIIDDVNASWSRGGNVAGFVAVLQADGTVVFKPPAPVPLPPYLRAAGVAPSSTAVACNVSQTTSNINDNVAFRACRIVGIEASLQTALTAGSLTAKVNHDGNPIPGMQVTVSPAAGGGKRARYDAGWDNGYPVPADGRISVSVDTDAGMLPASSGILGFTVFIVTPAV